MSAPVVTDSAERLYGDLGGLTRGDEATGWQLRLFLDALASVLLEPVDRLVRDRDEYPGWVIALDPDNAPNDVLPYLAQFVGVELEPELTELQRRDKIRLPEGFRRGTPTAIVEAAKRTLTGTQTVLLEERYSGAYHLRVRTFASETPDAAKTEAAIVSQKPIGIVLDYDAIDGMSWSDLEGDYATWAAVEAAFPDWGTLRSTLP